MKIEIDVGEAAIQEFISNCDTDGIMEIKRRFPVSYAIYEAYKAKKNKVEHGDWFVWGSSQVMKQGFPCTYTLDGVMRKLSPDAQRILNKELGYED